MEERVVRRSLFLSASLAISLAAILTPSHAQVSPEKQDRQSGAQNTEPQEPPLPPVRQLNDIAEITAEWAHIEDDGRRILARNVVVTLGEYVLAGGFLEGNIEEELLFTLEPVLRYRGQLLRGDRIRFAPRTKAFAVENLRAGLDPDFLKGKLSSPLYLALNAAEGTRRGPLTGKSGETTTCDKPHRDYFLRSGSIRVDPGRHVVLKNTSFVLFGKRVLSLPTLVIPLDDRLRREGFTPQVGRSQDEGLFVKTAINYVLGASTPGLYRVDLMEKKGLGLGLEQSWQMARIAGSLVLYGIPTGGSGSNLSARLGNRFNLGGGQTLSVEGDLLQNSYLSLPQTTSLNTRLNYQRQLGGSVTGLSLARTSQKSQGFETTSLSASLSQTTAFGRSGNASFNADFSRYENSGNGIRTTNEQLNLRFQGDYRAPNYLLQVQANRNVPVGQKTATSFFGGVERLPEITLSNYRFSSGALSRIPATFSLSAGKYSEGSGGGNAAKVVGERIVAGFDVTNLRAQPTKTTTLTASAGFTQSFYAEGAALYVLRNSTSLQQRFGGRSGVNFQYTYQQPHGGTPFRFDAPSLYHHLNADLGYLDDSRLQLSARVGYDFSRRSFGGFRQPWQTLSANLLLRPVPWARFQNLFSFDPNNGRVTALTSDLRLRGHDDFSFDLVTRYDPQRKKIGNANAYANLPIGKLWRILALVQYNGYLNRFESRNLQIVRDLHCMEASFTYMDNPFGFRSDRQILFQLKIKAFPAVQRFGTGAFGQALDTGVGGFF